ncbi:MAG: hypothetical protein EU533_01290 [Promethearchaeota archaeon]|nr:MAG: hypothetical protein EU533_01290 [Candidatus Lokiarchaeota archaeon]
MMVMKVAFDKINITPNDYQGKPLAGYDRKERCLGKLDEIHAYGVLLDLSNGKPVKNLLLLISVDILKLPLSIVKYIKKKIMEKFDSFNEDQIIIHATHTHSSFDLTGEFYYQGGALAFLKGIMFADNKNDMYIVWFANKIAQMVEKLFKELKPCKMAWKKQKFNPNLVLNRRWPKKKTIPDLGVISFKSVDDGSIIGIIINYACHPTSLSFLNNKLSADYPGRIVSKIESLTNNSIKTIYINGPSGDLNPITTSGTDYEKINEDKNLTYNQIGTYKHAIKIGTTIAKEALAIVNSMEEKNYLQDFELEIYSKKVVIPMKDARYFSKVWFSNSLKWLIKKYFLFKVARFDEKSVNFPFFTIKRKNLRRYGESIIHFFMIQSPSGKKIGIITVPGELFEDVGKRVIKASPTLEQNSFIFQNSQDWIGYLFPIKMYTEEGGYEPFMCFSPLCGYIIEKELMLLLNRIS